MRRDDVQRAEMAAAQVAARLRVVRDEAPRARPHSTAMVRQAARELFGRLDELGLLDRPAVNRRD